MWGFDRRRIVGVVCVAALCFLAACKAEEDEAVVVQSSTGETDSTSDSTSDASSTKAITAFSFEAALNQALSTDVSADVSEQAITATLPAGTDTTALVASFTHTGASIYVGSQAQTSGSTANDFSETVYYTVRAEDGTERTHSVDVSLAAASETLSSAKEVLSFAFEAAHNSGLPSDVSATVDGSTITATVPYAHAGTTLVPTFSLSSGASATVDSNAQTSASSSQDFLAPVDYVITAENGSSQTYKVLVVNRPVPDTGQTICFNAIGGTMTCPSSGSSLAQDGSYTSQNQPSFTDNGDGTVRDDVTGLVWQQCPAGTSGTNCATGSATTYTFDGAQSYCAGLSLGGQTDWRMPSIHELAWLVERQGSAPMIDAVFSSVGNGVYWSGQELAANTVNGWQQDFAAGSSFDTAKTNSTGRVRCVRGASQPATSYTDNGDSTVTDDATGLMWHQCISGRSGSDCASGSINSMYWADAIDYCETSTLAGYNDWRVPNRSEMTSLVDYTSTSSPVTDTTAFPNASSGGHWTSTSYYVDASQAEQVHFLEGVANKFNKTTISMPVRCVR